LQRSTALPSVVQRVAPVAQDGAARQVVTPPTTAQLPPLAQTW
jgi:hypothetical protein